MRVEIMIDTDTLVEWLDEIGGGKLYPRLTEKSRIVKVVSCPMWTYFTFDEKEGGSPERREK